MGKALKTLRMELAEFLPLFVIILVDKFWVMEDSLLIKYLLKETSKEESLVVKSWIESRKENEKYYNDFCWVWKKSIAIASTEEIDVDAAWEQFQNF